MGVRSAATSQGGQPIAEPREPLLRLADTLDPNVRLQSERELLGLRRARVSVILESLGRLTFLAVLACAGLWMIASRLAPALGLYLVVGCVITALLVLVWESIIRDSHRYCITDRRVLWRFGVFRRVIVETPLERVQNVVVIQPFLQRLLGIGAVSVSTAATDGVDVLMRYVVRPREVSRVLENARSQRSAMLGGQSMPVKYPGGGDGSSGQRVMPIIGIVGGIGAGKSTVAKEFQRLGCHVVDSDARAREALDRPEVREQLVAWWGKDILTVEGRVDRSKVGSIVFAMPKERARLEELVHPIIRQDRAKLVQEAARFWARGVIVDAPLLFEAGVDKECDAVVFVDAPREVRLQRVRVSRGWDDAELTRREAAQMPLDQKRARSRFIIINNGAADISKQAAKVLEELQRELNATA